MIEPKLSRLITGENQEKKEGELKIELFTCKYEKNAHNTFQKCFRFQAKNVSATDQVAHLLP